jgi:sporulation protein YlmC with PRC-barrel domain
MKARLCLVASLLLLAAPAFAQESPGAAGAEMQKNDPAAPSTTPTSPTPPAPPAATDHSTSEPSPSAMPAPGNQAKGPMEVDITELTAVDDDSKLVKPWNLPVDTVEEMDVFDANGKKIGEVDAVLQDKSGEVKGVVVEYGGFLGFGEKGAVVGIDQLKLSDGTIITDLSEDDLSQRPEWMK